MTARQVVEDVYNYVLSKKAHIHEQLEPLNKTGELQDMRNILKVLFRFGDVIEEQGKRIEELEKLAHGTTEHTEHNSNNPL